jgi:hypothetical protein
MASESIVKAAYYAIDNKTHETQWLDISVRVSEGSKLSLEDCLRMASEYCDTLDVGHCLHLNSEKVLTSAWPPTVYKEEAIDSKGKLDLATYWVRQCDKPECETARNAQVDGGECNCRGEIEKK